jgi:hypothetical protein
MVGRQLTGLLQANLVDQSWQMHPAGHRLLWATRKIFILAQAANNFFKPADLSTDIVSISLNSLTA